MQARKMVYNEGLDKIERMLWHAILLRYNLIEIYG